MDWTTGKERSMKVTIFVTTIAMALAISGCGDRHEPGIDDVIEYDCETDTECEEAYGNYVISDSEAGYDQAKYDQEQDSAEDYYAPAD